MSYRPAYVKSYPLARSEDGLHYLFPAIVQLPADPPQLFLQRYRLLLHHLNVHLLPVPALLGRHLVPQLTAGLLAHA